MISGHSIATIGLLLVGLVSTPANATWVVALADSETGEVGIGQATCVSGIDLRALSGVVVTGKGVATVQAYVDSSGVSRTTIRDELLAGTPPAQILSLLDSTDPDYETHQYCIVDTEHPAATYTGSTAWTFKYAGGQTGQVGSIRYCVAGNLLAGSPVVEQAVQALTDTSGGLADRLVAAMEAARSMGGDGRCSCSGGNPTGCGSPPPAFDVAAINGYLVVARGGDTADCAFCSGGDYYLDLNEANQPSGGPDPVTVLQSDYATFVADRLGIADAIESVVTITPPALLPDGASTSQMDVQLLDLDGQPITTSIQSFTVQQAAGSDAVTTIGSAVDLGGGAYATTLGAGVVAGVDRFSVVADDGLRPVTLMPEPRLPVGVPGEVGNLRWPDRGSLLWDSAPAATVYHVYRGDLGVLGCGYLGDCRDDLDADLTDLVLLDPSNPTPGEGWFYLIGAVDGVGNVGSLGISECGARAATDPCP